MKTRSLIVFAVTAAVILGTSWFLTHLRSFQRLGTPGVKVIPEPTFSVEGVVIATNSVYLPPEVLNFQGKILPVATEVLGWLPKDTTYGQRLYEAADGFQVMMNVVLMGSDRTSIHKPEYCLIGLGWEIGPPVPDTIPVSRPYPYDLPVMRIEGKFSTKDRDGVSHPMKSVMVYWFVADQQLTARHNERMKWMARDMIAEGVLQRWAYVSCFTVFRPGQEEAAYGRMCRLIAEAVPHFQLATGAQRPVAQLE